MDAAVHPCRRSMQAPSLSIPLFLSLSHSFFLHPSATGVLPPHHPSPPRAHPLFTNPRGLRA
eukprot:9256344-Prorocentrum_lima.AAC.1